MKLLFNGASRTVTGSCYFLDTGKNKVLVDCGAFQGPDEIDKKNREEFPFDPSEIEYVFLTHAHYDHCGRLPILVRQGFKGRIICTQPTRDLAGIVLKDSAHLQEEEYKRWRAFVKKRKGDSDSDNVVDHGAEGNAYAEHKPLFTEEDVNKTMELMEVYPYGNSVSLGEDFEFRMRDAGHILGSSMFEMWVKNEVGRTRKLVFSGDLGQPGQRIVRDPDMVREADYVFVESTYGNRLHKSKDETILELLSVMKKAQEQGGNVLIPTFAIEGTQELIYEMNLFYENKLMEGLEVYLDSPMAARATEVFKQYPTFYDEDARRLQEKGDDIFNFKEFKMTTNVEESKRLISKRPVVIMAGSGMCTGGRIIHHLANNVSRKDTHVVFVGYQVKGTLGRKIIDGEPFARIKGKNTEIHAQVHTLGGFSAHGDKRDLMYWLRGFGHSPRMIFVMHGEESIAEGFAQTVKEELRVDTYVPFHNEIVELD